MSIPYAPRPAASRTISSTSSVGRLVEAGNASSNGGSPSASSLRSQQYASQVEIEDSLRQWRNHVFPGLKSSDPAYTSPAALVAAAGLSNLPAPFQEPDLPYIFDANGSNENAETVCYPTGSHFLDDIEEHAHTLLPSWRLEMIVGQTNDAASSQDNVNGVWIALWSGKVEDGTRLLEIALMKLPARPLLLCSPLPTDYLPTAFLQERMQALVKAFLSHSNTPSDFSMVMGNMRLVDAFLLHLEAERTVSNEGKMEGNLPETLPTNGTASAPTPNLSNLPPLLTTASGTSNHTLNSSIVKSIKPLIHTRLNVLPANMSLSDGFTVRLAQESDDLPILTSLFQAYSTSLETHLEENAARKALAKAIKNKSVWIYHIFSVSLPGLTLIAGFLTVERVYEHNKSLAITAVYTQEDYRKRGVAEALIRTSARYYLTREEEKIESISALLDPKNQVSLRVFARLGFGIKYIKDKPVEPDYEEWDTQPLKACVKQMSDERAKRASLDDPEMSQKEEAKDAEPAEPDFADASTIVHLGEDALPSHTDDLRCRTFEEWQVVTLRKLQDSPSHQTNTSSFELTGSPPLTTGQGLRKFVKDAANWTVGHTKKKSTDAPWF